MVTHFLSLDLKKYLVSSLLAQSKGGCIAAMGATRAWVGISSHGRSS